MTLRSSPCSGAATTVSVSPSTATTRTRAPFGIGAALRACQYSPWTKASPAAAPISASAWPSTPTSAAAPSWSGARRAPATFQAMNPRTPASTTGVGQTIHGETVNVAGSNW